jgi:outer membrane protein
MERGKSMKHISRFTAIILLLILASGVSAGDLKVGVVDFQAIFESYEGFSEAESIFNKDMETWQNQKQMMIDDLLEVRDNYEVQRLMMTPETQKEKEAELAQLEAELYQFEQEKFGPSGEAIRRNQELSEPIYEKINEVVKTYAEEADYDLILDVSGTIIYQKQELLIDEEIKAALKAKG